MNSIPRFSVSFCNFLFTCAAVFLRILIFHVFLRIANELFTNFFITQILYADDEHLSPCINAGWAKLNKYYTKTNNSVAYVAAVVMDPSQKWQYFEQQWVDHPGWVPEWKGKVVQHWYDYYRNDASITVKELQDQITDHNTATQVAQSAKLSATTDQSNNIYVAHLQARRLQRGVMDEYERYCSTPPIDITDALQWWCEPSQKEAYPVLRIMAMDLLSIPAMSADAERLFSGANITVTDRRNRLGISMIEKLECLKSWMGVENWFDDEIDELEERADHGFED